MKSTQKQAIDNLNNLLQHLPPRSVIGREINNNVQILVQGINELDQEVKQKTFEVSNREQLLAQKDQILVQKEKKVGELQKTVFVDSLHKLYPDSYPAKIEQWPDTLPMKKHVVNNDVYVMEHNTKIYKEELDKKEQEDIKKEFIDILPKLYPQWYPVNFRDWSADSWGKKVIDGKNYKAMEDHLPDYRKWLADKMELIEILPKLHPESYPVKYENWTNQYGKQLLDQGKFDVIGQSLPSYRKQLVEKEQENIKKEFIKSLNELYPDSYSTDPTKWFNKDGKAHPMKEHYDKNNFYVMEHNTKIYKKQIEEIKAKKLEEVKRLKEEEAARKEQLLIDKYKETEDLKALIAQKELEKQEVLTQTKNVLNSKDQLYREEMESLRNLLLQKELETQEILAQRELEKKELLAQKEVELANKSLVKNQVIGELQEDIGLKEKEALNLKIESLMKLVELKAKEVELKDKALEDALEIGKQNKIINELQGKLLAFQNLSKHDETLKLELSVIHFKVEESILNGNVDEMKELSKYLSELIKNPAEEDESFEISELLNNLSPIVHGGENYVQNSLAVINNNHTTHSVLLSGEDFSIIQGEDSSLNN